MSKFQLQPRTVSAETFAGAPERPATAPDAADAIPTRIFNLKLTAAEMALLNTVFDASREKSKQKLVRRIVLDGLRAMGEP